MSSQKYPKVAGFELVAEIGGGGFSTVYRAVNVEEHRVAACKVILLTEDTTERERKNVDKEMRVHAALKHVHVLEFLNAVVVELKHKRVYVPGIYILLELAAGGDLFDKIAADVGVDEEVAQVYFNQLVSGMSYIHNQGVCHRDLKPENILLDAAGTLKITDFGLCAVFRLKESGKTRMLSEKCGSLPYVAPELNSSEPYHAEPIDVWGCGVILYTLLVGNTPWDEPSIKSPEFVRYVNGTVFSHRPWNRISPDALSLIRGMLTVNPANRITLDDVMTHPWCMRPSQLSGGNPLELANRLTRGLHDNGEMNISAPPTLGGTGDMDVEDEDTVMQSATSGQSQFTQTLMLFSQTQTGARYTPHLTRFYAAIGPAILSQLIKEYLESREISTRELPPIPSPDPRAADGAELYRLRIGGWDVRNQKFKGWVDVEHFMYRGAEGSFCVMRRDEGNPIYWRLLWRAVIESELVEPHVLRK